MKNHKPTEEIRGSAWHRWDPHLHTPGTVLNDKYGVKEPWEAFLDKIEVSIPPIQALGITDYLSIDRYEDVLRFRSEYRIPNVKLVFPNVEMRFGIGTSKGSAINLHLLFSPDDLNHVEEIRRFLRKLEFRSQKETYLCCREDLIRLGKEHDSKIQGDTAALEVGTNQFKISFDQLREEFEKSEWVRSNCLVAVAAGETDGTSGLRDPSSSFANLRKSIESFANIIFSSNPKQVEFWLGRGAATIADLESKWSGLKPCLHGSDAHQESAVGMPDEDRFCWLKGDLEFETLKQACIEPEGRVHIGVEAPRSALPAQTIRKIRVTNAEWMTPSELDLNPGLIAIIGARGSGKTALADLIAAGGLATKESMSTKSFVNRAGEHLQTSRSELEWENGETTGVDLRNISLEDEFETPAVQYLSQQFVDELCSSEGLSSSLVREIERVVFNSHSENARENAADFDELKSIKSTSAIEKRFRFQEELEEASNGLAEERLLKQSVDGLKKQRDDLAKQIAKDQIDKKSLVAKGHEDRAKRHETVSKALEERKRAFAASQTRIRTLTALKDDVSDLKTRRIPNLLSKLKEDRPDSGLTADEWKEFQLEFAGNPEILLRTAIKKASDESLMIGGAQPNASIQPTTADPAVPLIAEEANLHELPVTLLQNETTRLASLIGIDAQNAKRFGALSEKISKAQQALEKFGKQILYASKADERIQLLINRRQQAYAGVFAAVVELENELHQLYSPLAKRLKGGAGSLGKLTFSVRRQADIETLASTGEELLDLRKNGPFKGRGELLNAAEKMLRTPWETGTPEDVSLAMSSFIKENEGALRIHRPEGADNRAWSSSVAKWLHGTDHISVSYGLCYDGVDVECLSQGTRGIVLLMLYLAIDEEDDRPLIIDQPEESLDPQSVFDELVGRFRDARNRRQVIIVTHNANLVVNTDVDQVIVANAQPQKVGTLPNIHYECGGLENPYIRKRVCEILEGGERAFRARARRLRVKL